ncbi:MAG: hypothetical protein ACYTDU_21355 [Planctomycetota bacterium]|jgi:hypothetical protein
MRHILTLLAIVALVVGAGCGDKESAATPGTSPDTIKTPPAKTPDITYVCPDPNCGKEKTLAATAAPPS